MIPQPLSLTATTALGACLLGSSLAAAAQPEPSPPPVAGWVVNADELLRMALTNNVNILLSEVQPQIDQFSLRGIYGAYDPSFTASTTHTYDSFPGGMVETTAGLRAVATVEQVNAYQLGLSGLTPWGLNYNFSGPLQEQNVVGAPDYYNSSPNVQLSQPVLKNFWIDNARFQIANARSTLKIDQLAVRNQIMTVVNGIKAAYYTLISDEELVTVQEIAVKLAEETAREDEEKVKAGAEAPLEEKQSESQAASARSDLLNAQATLSTQQNVIKALLGLRRRDWTNLVPVSRERLVAVPEKPDVWECWQNAFTKRPDMLQARLKAEAQHLQLKLDKNQLFPELDVVGSYGRNATELTFGGSLDTIRQGTYPDYSYGAVLTVPLGNIGARNKMKADRATLEQLKLQIAQLELTIVPTIDNDVNKIRTDFLRVDSTRLARIYAEEALQAEQTKLEHGKSTSFVVLQLQKTLTSSRSDEIQALANYNIDLDQLAFDEGTILERNHIELRAK